MEGTAPYYRAMDVMVLPTWREGFPSAVLEAGASGVPVVTTLCDRLTRFGGAGGDRTADSAGIPGGDQRGGAETVARPGAAPSDGQAARAWVQKNYANEYVLGLTAEFYKGMLMPAVEAVVQAADQIAL